MLNDSQLALIMRRISPARRAAYLQPLNAAMQERGITTLARVSAFLGQIGHESGELVWMEELWGPTDAQRRYEPPSTLAQRLGNTQKGDGFRYKGRGPIQITGRDNYKRYGELLGLDLVGNPQQAATPGVGFRIAALFWQRNGLNELADAGDYKAITRRINGGFNGLEHRLLMLERARSVLAPTWPAGAVRGVPTPAAELKPLPRGAEEIAKAADDTDAAEVGGESKGKGKGKGKGGAKKRGQAASDAATAAAAGAARKLDARRDTMDFRDIMFTPTLVEVPSYVPLSDYVDHGVPVLDQGKEGACTGYGLATVVHYLQRRRKVVPDTDPISPRMLYDMARRYDEWPGEKYEGSSARGAMKGWHKHGVCSEADWPSNGRRPAGGFNEARVSAARKRPLGAYFRVNHTDIVAMHAAIAEVGVLYATASVHSGWEKVDGRGDIPLETTPLGGHAFAIVAYDQRGFWIQNSWGPDWGSSGFARICYDDWLANGTDAWVARLGAPIELQRLASTAVLHPTPSGQSVGYAYEDLRPHVISVGNDGELSSGGTYGTDEQDVRDIFEHDMPRVMASWDAPRVLIYAHGGLVSEEEAIQRVAEYRPALLARGVYPIAFAWHSDFATTLKNILAEAGRRRRSEGALDDLKDFMLDRVDDMLEPVARGLFGKLAWSEMKENARGASLPGHAADIVVRQLAQLAKKMPGLEIHLVGHSAGAIFLAPMLALLKRRGLAARTCSLWAPACTHADFTAEYAPALEAGTLGKLALFMLGDQTEQNDNCAHIYNKSLLYLVSHAFERDARIPGSKAHPGVPLLGMAKFIDADHQDYMPAFHQRLQALGVDIVIAPNDRPEGDPGASKAEHHGDFDNDMRTVLATLARVIGPATKFDAGAVRDPMSGERTTRVKVVNPAMLERADEVTVKLGPSLAASRQRRATLDRLTRRQDDGR